MAGLNSDGFTVIELVVSIALLAIVAVSTSSRWFSADAFSAATLKSQLLGEARLAQRAALTNNQVVVRLVISQSAGDWRYQIYQDATLFRDVRVAVDNVSIQATAGITSALGPGVDLDLQYDGLGNVSAVVLGGVAGNVTSGISVVMAGDRSMCVSPLGFAHDGDCV